MDSKRLKVKITVSVQLQVELANTNVKSNDVYKKRELQLNEFTR